MEPNFIKNYINDVFQRLIEIHGLEIIKELNQGQLYMIEFISKDFVIKLEKYFREFYASLYKVNRPDEEINLFNLLEYLRQDDTGIFKSEYFHKEKDIKQCYIKQLNYISSVIYENYTLIDDFFADTNYEIKIAEFEQYWKNKHPGLYKGI